MKELKEKIEEKIKNIAEEGITPDNIKELGQLVDIHKDLANEEYWDKKKEVYDMRYNDYNEGGYNGYGRRGVPGTGRRYRGEYGRRGVPGSGRGRYRGEEMLNEMQDNYSNYSEAKEEFNAGNYSAGEDTMESFEYMLKSFKDFFKHLKKEASSQEEVEMLQEIAREIGQM